MPTDLVLLVKVKGYESKGEYPSILKDIIQNYFLLDQNFANSPS